MKPETRHVRDLIWSLYDTDILHKSSEPLNVEARQLALMVLHEEYGLNKLHAEREMGNVGGFAGDRRLLMQKIERQEETRTRIAAFYALMDANPMDSRLRSAKVGSEVG